MTYFELLDNLEKNSTVTLLEFCRTNKITEEDLAQTVCYDEYIQIDAKVPIRSRRRLGSVDTAKVVDISYPTLGRRRTDIDFIPFEQPKSHSRIYYSVRHIAMYLYIKNNPPIDSEVSFAPLFIEHLQKINYAKFKHL